MERSQAVRKIETASNLEAAPGAAEAVAVEVERTVLRRVLERSDVELVVLFGSFARRDERRDSDVDLLIDGPIANSTRDLSELRGELMESLGRSVELLTVHEAEGVPAVYSRVLADGRPIRDPSSRWPLLEAQAERVRRAAAAEHRTYRDRERKALESFGRAEA